MQQLGKGSTTIMGMGMWLKRYTYTAGEKRNKCFKEIISIWSLLGFALGRNRIDLPVSLHSLGCNLAGAEALCSPWMNTVLDFRVLIKNYLPFDLKPPSGISQYEHFLLVLLFKNYLSSS